MTWLGDFDIVGHYDYVARYAPYPQASIFYRDFSDIFDAMFKYLAQEGKALEINTKTYKDYHGRTPEMDIAVLRRFRELGGEAVSLGSDSHDAQRTGDNFLHFADVVRSAGFRFPALRGRRPQRRVQVSCPFRVQTAPHDSAVMLTGTAGRPAAERAQGMSGYKKRGLQSSFFVSLSGPPLFRGIARSGVSSLIRCIRAFDIFRDTVHTDID